MKKNQNGFGAVEVILIIIIATILGGLGFILYKNLNTPTNTPRSDSTKASSSKNNNQTNVAADSYKDWKTYNSTMSSLAVRYPSTWKQSNYPSVNIKQESMESGGFTSPEDAQGRIFVIGLNVNGDRGEGTAPQRYVYKSIPINSNYLIMYNAAGVDEGVTSLALSKSNLTSGISSQWFEDDFQTNTGKLISISGEIKVVGAQTEQGYSLEEYMNDSRWQDAVMILKSINI